MFHSPPIPPAGATKAGRDRPPGLPCALPCQLPPQRGQGALQRLPDKPSLLVGDRIEGLDGLRRRAGVELHRPPVRWMRGSAFTPDWAWWLDHQAGQDGDTTTGTARARRAGASGVSVMR